MKLDRISKHVLVKLAELEEATASELREALGVEQNQSIHYRMDEKLIPQKLAHEHPDREEQPGSRKAARVYQITPEGEEWVAEHGHEITLADIDEAEQEIQRLSAELRSISSDVQSLKKWQQKQSGQTGGISNSVGKLGDRVDDLDERVQKHDRRDYSEIWDRLHELDEHTDRLSKKLDEPLATANDIEQVNKDVQNLSNRLDSLESHLDNLQASHNDWAEWGNQTDQRVKNIEQHASQGLLGRLRWLLFGY